MPTIEQGGQPQKIEGQRSGGLNRRKFLKGALATGGLIGVLGVRTAAGETSIGSDKVQKDHRSTDQPLTTTPQMKETTGELMERLQEQKGQMYEQLSELNESVRKLRKLNESGLGLKPTQK